MRGEKGFTLFELIIAVVVIIIMATISIPAYNKSKERALGRETVSNLKLIIAAEKIYRMNNSSYMVCQCYDRYSCSDESGGCNALLKINLDTQNWDYAFESGVPNPPFASATRKGSGGYLDCVYTLGILIASLRLLPIARRFT